jgi:hypothetical protein
MITDTKPIVKNRLLTKRGTLILMLSILLISFFNVFLTTVGIPNVAAALNPAFALKGQVMLRTSLPILIVIPFGSFVLSLLFSFIPYKQLRYSQKYFSFGLFIWGVIEIVVLGLLLSDYIK